MLCKVGSDMVHIAIDVTDAAAAHPTAAVAVAVSVAARRRSAVMTGRRLDFSCWLKVESRDRWWRSNGSPTRRARGSRE